LLTTTVLFSQLAMRAILHRLLLLLFLLFGHPFWQLDYHSTVIVFLFPPKIAEDCELNCGICTHNALIYIVPFLGSRAIF
jgi:hypothetical protein